MSDADEALLWARETAKKRFSSPEHTNICAQIDSGVWDDDLTYSTDAYRAGAAASADRIKALEARVAELEDVTHRIKYPRLRRRTDNEGGR